MITPAIEFLPMEQTCIGCGMEEPMIVEEFIILTAHAYELTCPACGCQNTILSQKEIDELRSKMETWLIEEG